MGRAARGVARKARRAAWRVGYERARWPRPLGTRPPIGLAVCAIFRDEARYLPEWVTFHRLQGVERFWLYDNLSDDGWRSALAPELRSGLVEVTPWSDHPGQFSAYSDCLRRHRDDARWIALIDLDEFLFSPTGRPLPEVLRSFDTHPAVAANWRVYGVGSPDGLVVETHLLRAPDGDPVNLHVKSIVYPRKTSTFVENPHHFRHWGRAVGEDRRQIDSSLRDPPTVNLLRINHYFARSQADLDRKLGRPRADTGEMRTGARIPVADEVHDETMLRFAPALRDAMAARGRCYEENVPPAPPEGRRRRGMLRQSGR